MNTADPFLGADGLLMPAAVIALENTASHPLDNPVHEWVFTFGSGQRGYSRGRNRPTDPDETTQASGFRLDDRYVVITGTWVTARERMFAIFGPVWSMQYPGREAAGCDRYGLTELVLTDDWGPTE